MKINNCLYGFKANGPGVLVALIIAGIATLVEELLPIHLIGASVIALFMGISINAVKPPTKKIQVGLKFTSKRVLKLAIILLGLSLNITAILTVGRLSLMVMVFTLFTCFGGGYFCGKALGLNWKLSNLISAGTGICGGSAIAAVAPVIEADDKDIAYAMSATFLFDMAMILLFPLMGHALGLSDMAYGLWAGTAVNDTSSVVATGYAYSEAAGDFATMVKLTRTLSIIPTVLAFVFINMRVKQRALLALDGFAHSVHAVDMRLSNDNVADAGVDLVDRKSCNNKVSVSSLFPWFILGFVGLAVVNSFGIIPEIISSLAKDFSKFLMVAALAAIGLNTSYKEMKHAGVRPMLHGFIISALVVIVALGVEIWMGLV